VLWCGSSWMIPLIAFSQHGMDFHFCSLHIMLGPRYVIDEVVETTLPPCRVCTLPWLSRSLDIDSRRVVRYIKEKGGHDEVWKTGPLPSQSDTLSDTDTGAQCLTPLSDTGTAGLRSDQGSDKHSCRTS
jgi:hypothetical protein